MYIQNSVYVDLAHLDAVNLLESSLDLWLGGLVVHDEDHGVLIFELLHVLFCDQGVA